MRKINLLNGDCALEAWKQCALAGETLVWRENYLHGRLPDTADLTAFNSIRAEELHTIANGAMAAEIFADLQTMHNTLLSLNADDLLTLWFDYCPFDRTMLARVLYLLSTMPAVPQIRLIIQDTVWDKAAFLRYADTGIMLTGSDLCYGKEQWQDYCGKITAPENLMQRFTC